MASQQLQTIIQIIRSQPDLQGAPVEQRRAAMEAVTVMFPVPDDVTREPVDAGGAPAEWIATPGAEDENVILYLHGGSYTKGSINTHREMISRLSRASGARALAIDYRLAPEHPFPAAVEDATTGESMTTKAAVDPMITREDVLESAQAYLSGVDPRTPLASPLHADLSGLPPLLIQVGTAEVLLDDSTRLAERARSAGVDVTLEVWDDMIHVFQFFASMLPEGQQAIDRIGEFVREHVGAKAAVQ